MNTAALKTFEKKHEYPILIVDKLGLIGQKLTQELKSESLIIFVSEKATEEENVIHVPYLKKIPTIPDNTYSHIFIIDEYGKIAKDFLSQFVQKAKHDNSKLVVVININYLNEEFAYNCLSSYEKVSIIIFSDIFAKDFIFDNSTTVNKFIKQIRDHRAIEVPGDGTAQTNPVFLDDVVLGILQASFIEGENSRIFFLYPKHKPTLLSLAHMFQKKDALVKIDFSPKLKIKKEKLDINLEGRYLLEDDYDLSSRIKQVDIENNEVPEVKRGEYESLSPSRRFPITYLFTSVTLILIFFFILPLISTLILSAGGGFYLVSLKNNLENQKLSDAKTSAFNGYNLLRLAKTSSTLLAKEAAFLGREKDLYFISEKINQGIEISYSASVVLDNIEKIKSVISGNSKNQTEDFTKISDDLKNALVVYQKQKQAGNIPRAIDEKLSSIINFTSTTMDLWPDILGFNGTKTYMVLLQNNMELRPGGGFIGSYGILSLNQGIVKGFKIFDVYDADGQLKSRVEPPFAIRRYFSSKNWYLRDSNFDVDFSKDAVASAVFLNSEMHQGVDGVIGVDLSFVKKLLMAIGPVRVSDYNETINSNNLFQSVSSHTQKNFFAGSTQKKDFLSALYSSIQQKVSSNNDVSYLSLVSAISDSVYEKHIVFAFNNVSLQSTFSVNGWGSTLFDQRPRLGNTINDFLGINEANLGANKVNYFITRSISHNLNIKNDGSVNGNLKINFKNSASKTLGKDGFYKSFLRIILPQGSTIDSLKIDGIQQEIVNAITDPVKYEAKNFIPPTGLEVYKQDEEGKTIYGFLNLVDNGKLRVIDINYSLLAKLDLSKSDFSYDLKLFKQPGIDSIPYNFSLNYPNSLRPLNLSKSLTKDTNRVFMSEDVTKDMQVQVNLAKQ